ncbi:hypothetical protein BDZ91DRAFT_732557, partial [Kalaharituber pfeilii]
MLSLLCMLQVSEGRFILMKQKRDNMGIGSTSRGEYSLGKGILEGKGQGEGFRNFFFRTLL